MLRLLLVSLGVTLLTCGSGHAQMVSRAEHGAIPLTLEPLDGGAPVTVSRGERVFDERLTPGTVVRLTEDAPERRRPGPLEGGAAGDLLYGVQLSSGYAYCQRISYDEPRRRVQCYRDFDDDGTFDGGYVTEHDGFASQIIPSILRGLTGIPKTAYAAADPADFGAVDAFWTFHRWRRGEPQFYLHVDDERLSDPSTCEPIEDTPELCEMAGLALRVTETSDGGATIAIAGQAQQRVLMIITSGVL
ncbi:MAG: hypothetical protein RIA71_03035 [Oceanicaulis sp.]